MINLFNFGRKKFLRSLERGMDVIIKENGRETPATIVFVDKHYKTTKCEYQYLGVTVIVGIPFKNIYPVKQK